MHLFLSSPLALLWEGVWDSGCAAVQDDILMLIEPLERAVLLTNWRMDWRRAMRQTAHPAGCH